MGDTRYYTLLNDMKGEGHAVIPGISTPVSETITEQPKGRAFSNMVVNGRLKTAIENGIGGDFFHFTPVENEDNTYRMQAKLPEYGLARGKGSSEKFKLRENINRLAKGVASKFIDENGEVNFQKGLNFVSEMEIKLFETENKNEDQYTDSLNWLCENLDIPKEERSDFTRFCRTVFDRLDPPAYSSMNFFGIWSKWGTAGLAFEEQTKDGASDSTLWKNAKEGYQNAINEIKELANIDPATEMRMITVTECTGSTASNNHMAQYARNLINAENKERAEKENTGQKAAEAKGPDPDSIRVNLNDNPNPIAPDAGELKWDEHAAPVLGQFQYAENEGEELKTYYLTVEAFAPEVNVYMEHPGMTHGLAIGVYESLEDFRAYYYKDDQAYIHIDDETKKFLDDKQQVTAGFDAANRERQKAQSKENKVRLASIKNLMSKDMGMEFTYDEAAVVVDQYHEKNPGSVANDVEAECRDISGDAHRMISRIPEEHQKAYKEFLDAFDAMNDECNEYEMMINHYHAAEKYVADPNVVSQKVKELENRSRGVKTVRTIAKDMLQAIITGNTDALQNISQEQVKLLDNGLRYSRITAEQAKNMAIDTAGKIRPHLPEQVNGVITEQTLETMESYRISNNTMTRDEKTEHGAKIIEAVTGVNPLNADGSMNKEGIENLMSNVLINGIPFRAAMDGKVDQSNFEQMIDRMAGCFVDQMDVNKNPAEYVSLLSNEKMVPIIHEPGPLPQITTKVSFFSSKEKKAAFGREKAAYDEAVKRREIWDEKNKLAQEKCKVYEELRGTRIDVQKENRRERISFAELADDVSRESGRRNPAPAREMNTPERTNSAQINHEMGK